MQHRTRVWIESDDGGNRTSLVRSFNYSTHDQLVTKVQPVKHAECQDGRSLDIGVVSSVKESHAISYVRAIKSNLKEKEAAAADPDLAVYA